MTLKFGGPQRQYICFSMLPVSSFFIMPDVSPSGDLVMPTSLDKTTVYRKFSASNSTIIYDGSDFPGEMGANTIRICDDDVVIPVTVEKCDMVINLRLI